MQILFIALFFPIFIPPLCVCVCESFFYLWMFSFNSGKKNSNIINPDLQKRPWCANNFFGPYKIFFWLVLLFLKKRIKQTITLMNFQKVPKRFWKLISNFWRSAIIIEFGMKIGTFLQCSGRVLEFISSILSTYQSGFFGVE